MSPLPQAVMSSCSQQTLNQLQTLFIAWCPTTKKPTRMITHAINASEASASVIATPPNTCVAVLLLADAAKIQCDVGMLTGTGDKKQIPNITAMASNLGQTASALSGLHAFTGCDVTSSFSGREKLTAYELLKDQKCAEAMRSLGQNQEVGDHLLELLEYCTCKLNGFDNQDVNKLRFSRFMTNSGASHMLPSCRDSLRQHCC